MNCIFYKISKITFGPKFGQMRIDRVYLAHARGSIYFLRDKAQANQINRIFKDE